jgi:acyl-CoA thioester hydrolase
MKWCGINKMGTLFEHSVKLNIPFHDTDAMQVVWHGNYLKYFEIARDAMFSEKGIDLFDFFCRYGYLFPIIRSSVKYISPLRVRDEIVCTASLKEARRKIIVDFAIRRVADNVLCATGTTEQAAVLLTGTGMDLEIPKEIRDALGASNDI